MKVGLSPLRGRRNLSRKGLFFVSEGLVAGKIPVSFKVKLQIHLKVTSVMGPDGADGIFFMEG